MTTNGYDLGGAEYPTEGLVVVDIAEPLWDGEPGQWIKRDLRQDFSDLPAKSYIFASKLLRYLWWEDGYLDGAMISNEAQEGQREFARRLDRILLAGGTVHLFDHLECMVLVLTTLERLGYVQNTFELASPSDDDLPAEYEVVLIKPA